MRVSLAFVEDRVNVWLRFGEPTVEIVLDRWRRVAMFVPGTVCCRVKWIGNVSGTALWQLLVMQAPAPLEDAAGPSVAGVLPGARILLRSDGEAQVEAVLAVIDAIEALGIDPCTVAASYWRKVWPSAWCRACRCRSTPPSGTRRTWRVEAGNDAARCTSPRASGRYGDRRGPLGWADAGAEEPRFVYNPSASVAPGWYIERMERVDSLHVGSDRAGLGFLPM